MKRYLYVWLCLIFSVAGIGQNDQLWKGYFSFNEIKDLSQDQSTIYAAAENALFSKNLNTNTLKTTTTVDGLSGQTITALYHSQTLSRTMVGYDNGLIIVINDADGTMTNVVDIINKQLPPNIKRVNHFMEYNGIVYVSCDFGIVQYNLGLLQFGDTYFIGDNGAEIIVKQTAVYNDYIYAATNSGLRRALVANPNLVDFSQWSNISGGVFVGTEAFANELVSVDAGGTVSRFNGNTFSTLISLPLPAVDLRGTGDYLVVTTSDRVYVYNSSFIAAAQVDSNLIPEMNAVFTAATVIGETIYIGTFENAVVTAQISNPAAFDYISPNGPARNNLFSINKQTANLWAVYGDYTLDYDPDPLRAYGISKYNTNGWTNIPYEDVHPQASNVYDLVRVTVNPSLPNTIYVSSFYNGLVKFEDGIFSTVYNETNTGSAGLESIFPTDAPTDNIRVEQSAIDRNGNLWMTNGLVKNAIKVMTPSGSWQSYNVEGIVSNFMDTRYGRMVIDKNSTKWICTTKDGLVAFNESGSPQFKKITFGDAAGGLPTFDVRAVAIDNRNQVWIGTTFGLRVLSSVDRFNTPGQMTANMIVISVNGVGAELLAEQFITDIAVDGSNNKWIATADSGVFQLSPDGQETLHQFTISNSPLPSNSINDIEIDGATGEVFIATAKGMVSFKGTSTEGKDDLSNVYVYPNPVRPEFAGTVKISGLTDKAHVKIADITGSLVYETVTEGGTIEWDTTAFGKYKVASGVYMIFVSTENGDETTVKKVMIVR
jgi:hypothetical protein